MAHNTNYKTYRQRPTASGPAADSKKTQTGNEPNQLGAEPEIDPPRPNVTVSPKGDESVESLLRRFNREMMRAGVVRRMKELEFYEKPSLRRKRKREEKRRFARERTYTREIEWVEE